MMSLIKVVLCLGLLHVHAKVAGTIHSRGHATTVEGLERRSTKQVGQRHKIAFFISLSTTSGTITVGIGTTATDTIAITDTITVGTAAATDTVVSTIAVGTAAAATDIGISVKRRESARLRDGVGLRVQVRIHCARLTTTTGGRSRAVRSRASASAATHRGATGARAAATKKITIGATGAAACMMVARLYHRSGTGGRRRANGSSSGACGLASSHKRHRLRSIFHRRHRASDTNSAAATLRRS